MHDFTPLPALLGGVLLGLAASLLLLTHGAVAGVSGLYAGLFRRSAPNARVDVPSERGRARRRRGTHVA